MRDKLQKMKDHVYQNRAKYTAAVTVPVTALVMRSHYKPYVDVAKVMAVFIHDHELGQKFLALYQK
jgi:hypothetical protein